MTTKSVLIDLMIKLSTFLAFGLFIYWVVDNAF